MNSHRLNKTIVTLTQAEEDQIDSAQYYLEHCLQTNEPVNVVENLNKIPRGLPRGILFP